MFNNMKKMIAKQAFRAFAAMALLVCALMFTANRAEAQATLNNQNVNFVGGQEALDRLGPAIQFHHNNIVQFNLIPGTPQYTEQAGRAMYMKAVYSRIQGGMATLPAITETSASFGINGVASIPTTNDVQFTSTLLKTIEGETKNLLD